MQAILKEIDDARVDVIADELRDKHRLLTQTSAPAKDSSALIHELLCNYFAKTLSRYALRTSPATL